MDPLTLRSKVCSLYQLEKDEYKAYMLEHTLFKRVRLVCPVVRLFYPDYLFHEKHLVDRIAKAHTLKEVQNEIDFYQHKYVINSLIKDALRFRISGMRIMSIANKAFKHRASPLGKNP